ncbi:MAG TPA: phage holin family protein [Candidatus Goldiibacteriota bacterium]|nr:phage holin family protein [Candidatus Goldiibacteriota bacterium]
MGRNAISYMLAKWMINMAALFIVVRTVKGLNLTATGVEGIITLAAASAVIGLINTFIRPVIILLTLPINVISFGLFTLVINGVIFIITGSLVRGFEVKSLWGAVIGSLIFSLVSMVAGWLLVPRQASQRVEYRVIK